MTLFQRSKNNVNYWNSDIQIITESGIVNNANGVELNVKVPQNKNFAYVIVYLGNGRDLGSTCKATTGNVISPTIMWGIPSSAATSVVHIRKIENCSNSEITVTGTGTNGVNVYIAVIY